MNRLKQGVGLKMTGEMDISKVLKESCIDLNLKALTKEDTLSELTDLLVKDGCISSKEEFLKDVYEREKAGCTGVGDYIAIPHGKSEAVIKTSIAIGRSNHEIQWGSLDGLPVKCIILFAVRNIDISKHVTLLSKVASALCEDDVMEKILITDSKAEIIRLFK